MNGFPRTINNKQDVLNLIDNYPDEMKKFLNGLIESKNAWLFVEALAEGNAGITDDTHKVCEVSDENDVVTGRDQYELVLDANGPIFRLGYADVQEVQTLLSGI